MLQEEKDTCGVPHTLDSTTIQTLVDEHNALRKQEKSSNMNKLVSMKNTNMDPSESQQYEYVGEHKTALSKLDFMGFRAFHLEIIDC